MNSTTHKFFFLFLLGSLLHAQNFTLETEVTDEDASAIIFPDAILFNVSDSTQVYEAMGDESGKIKFEEIEAGEYYLEIDVLGYNLYKSANFRIDSNENLGKIKLKKDAAISLNEAVIKSDKPGIQYKVDRQIINAESFSEANVAIDLLENVPSVSVDVNGNVKYRGDGTFRVFINGHPVANGMDKLKEIPTAQIERIEIITNPPAQYASQGTAGIIQVILKKKRLQGYAINANAFANAFGGLSGYFSIDQKSEKSGWYVNASGGKSVWNKYNYSLHQTTVEEGSTYQTIFNEKRENGNKQMNLEAGFNYDLTDKDYIDVAVNINPFATKHFNLSKGNVVSSVFDANGNLTSEENYRLRSDGFEKYQFFGGTINYEHAFNDDKSHKLSAYADVNYFVSPYEEKRIDEKIFENRTERIGSEGFEKNELIINAKINYAYPISEKSSFEVGTELEAHQIPEIGNENGMFDENEQIIPYSNQRSNQVIDFRRNIYSGYATFKSSIGKFEYQFGLRLENTDTQANYSYTEDGENFHEPQTDNFTKLFPSAHLLYNLSDKTQIVANYTRRINRPGYSQFVPIRTYSSVTSFYRGNAAIKPTYTDAYELGYKQNWTNKNYISLQVFHRVSHGAMWNISSVSQNNDSEAGTVTSTPQNVGMSMSTGVELMGNYKFSNWWEANLSTSLYNYNLEVDYADENYEVNQFNYQFKFHNTFLLPAEFKFRLNFNYMGPGKGAQDTREGYLNSSASIQKSIMNDRWTFTIGGDNVFDTMNYKYRTEGENFSMQNEYDHLPNFFLRVAFKFDNQN